MTDTQTAAGVRWRTLAEIQDSYFERPSYCDGKSAAELIRRAQSTQRLLRSLLQFAKAGRQLAFVDALKRHDDDIEDIKRNIHRQISKDGALAVWIAYGRESPKSHHELIPPDYWPFLTLDMENNAATGEELSFRDLRCALTNEIPDSDPIHKALRLAGKPAPRLDQHDGASADLRSDCALSIVPDRIQEIERTGAPGRPSSMHFVVFEFRRRLEQNEVIWNSIRAEAQHLAAWFKDFMRSYPRPLPSLGAGTIENEIRTEYNKAKTEKSAPTK
jgi:hypothetical protein